MAHDKRIILSTLTLIIVAVTFVMAQPVFAMPAAQDGTETPTPTPTPPGISRAVITSPGISAEVSGVVSIIGSALDPDFDYYTLEFAPDPSPEDVVWQEVQPPVLQQVDNNVLAAWDTAELEDRRYILRLTLFRTPRNARPIVYEVRVLVSNATPTPEPTIDTRVTNTLVPGLVTPGPSPTRLIQQPPTRTPRPDLTPENPADDSGDPSGPVSPLEPGRLRNAARNGVIITLGFFVVLGLYTLVRSIVRGTFADSWQAFRSEILNPLRNELSGRRRKK